MPVRPARLSDIPVWATMRAALWPDADVAELAEELPAMLSDDRLWNFILLDDADSVTGFAEVQLCTMFDGSPVAPYPHVEGIWVDASLRRTGGAGALLAAIEERARNGGYNRIGSDVELDNISSQAWHQASGFTEEARSILYSKSL